MDRKADLGIVMGFLVHDLRNTVASLGANVEYLKEVQPPPTENESGDVRQALDDSALAAKDLLKGLEHFALIGRWLMGEPAFASRDGNLVQAVQTIQSRHPHVTLELDHVTSPLRAKGAAILPQLVELLLDNCVQYGRDEVIRMRLRQKGQECFVDLIDSGYVMAPEFRTRAFTIEGQSELKSRADGRYGRFLGLVAARAVADAMGATLEADEEQGKAVFRIRLEKV